MLRSVAAALQEYAAMKSAGRSGRMHHLGVAAECRATVARYMGVSDLDVALVPSASAAMNSICAWAALEPGDNVVVNNLEFPSVTLPFLRLRDDGVDVRVVQHERWSIDPGRLLGAVDARTRILAVSHVSYVNGLRHDLVHLREGLADSTALLVVDATQTLGVLPVPVEEADFMVCSGYKWLLGIHGAGILYWNRSRQAGVVPRDIGPSSVVEPYAANGYDAYALKPGAERFELGYPAFPPMYALRVSVPVLADVGIEIIANHVLSLGTELLNGLKALDVEVMTPKDRSSRGASISFAHPRANEIGHRLDEMGIRVWFGDGRVRASTHLFNGLGDVQSYLEALEVVLKAA
ncbi:MAG: aminotransferase class V-fold PLP-dependent enzyme [Candidatus Dormibacteraeota bacterium]|nr:aminotransferase class V-fold PLP-dependent enzyme [Candidatus Dormibacteraeota bacterium]